jgi:hypothetical protein
MFIISTYYNCICIKLSQSVTYRRMYSTCTTRLYSSPITNKKSKASIEVKESPITARDVDYSAWYNPIYSLQIKFQNS